MAIQIAGASVFEFWREAHSIQETAAHKKSSASGTFKMVDLVLEPTHSTET
jgi:hypothetical protein